MIENADSVRHCQAGHLATGPALGRQSRRFVRGQPLGDQRQRSNDFLGHQEHLGRQGPTSKRGRLERRRDAAPRRDWGHGRTHDQLMEYALIVVGPLIVLYVGFRFVRG